jgi:hypothetical protein
VTKTFQCKLYMTWPQILGPRRFQNRSDFIGYRGMLKQVRSLLAWIKLHTLAFTKASQCLKRLAHKHNPPLYFLLFAKKIGQLLLGGLVSFLIIGGIRHRKQR